MIHQANLARDVGRHAVDDAIRDTLIKTFRDDVKVGLSDTTGHATKPGQRKARLLLEVLRDREDDVLRFAHDLRVPPTSNQAERDLRPAKIQQNIPRSSTTATRCTPDATRSSAALDAARPHPSLTPHHFRQSRKHCGHFGMPSQPGTARQSRPSMFTLRR